MHEAIIRAQDYKSSKQLYSVLLIMQHKSYAETIITISGNTRSSDGYRRHILSCSCLRRQYPPVIGRPKENPMGKNAGKTGIERLSNGI